MTNVITVVHLAMISGEFHLSDTSYKGDRIYFWNLGACLKPLLTLQARLWLKHLKGKRNTGTSTCTQVMQTDVHVGVFVCLRNVCISGRTWSYVWLLIGLAYEVLGRMVDPPLLQNFFFGYYYLAKRT